MYSREIGDMFFVGQLSGLVENFHIAICSDNKILSIKLYLFMPLSLNLIISMSQQCRAGVTVLCFYPIKLKLCKVVKQVK